MRGWLLEQDIKIGDTVQLLCALEYYRDEVQLIIHKIRLIKSSAEEQLMFQQAIMTQKVFFDPHQPYQRRLFGKGTEDARNVFQRPKYVEERNAAPIEDMDPNE